MGRSEIRYMSSVQSLQGEGSQTKVEVPPGVIGPVCRSEEGVLWWRGVMMEGCYDGGVLWWRGVMVEGCYDGGVLGVLCWRASWYM